MINKPFPDMQLVLKVIIKLILTFGSHSSLATPRSLQHLISAFDLADSHALPYCRLFLL